MERREEDEKRKQLGRCSLAAKEMAKRYNVVSVMWSQVARLLTFGKSNLL